MDSVGNALQEILGLSGIIGAALVDSQTNAILAKALPEKVTSFNLDAAAAGNAGAMRSKLEAMKHMGLGDDEIEDIIITLGKHYHLLRPIPKTHGVFLYCALEKKHSNPILARELMARIAKTISTQMISL